MSKLNRVVWCDRGWQPVWFGFCPTAKAWRREMRKMNADEPYPTTAGRTTSFVKDGKTRVLVTIDDGAEHRHTSIEIMGLIIHEAVHVWQEVRDAMGEEKPSAEFEAYAVQAIAQDLFGAWAKTRGNTSPC